MATKMFEIGLMLLTIALVLFKGGNGQSSCTSTLMRLAPCMNYVTGNTSTPSSSCCSSLANVVQSQPQCLCSMLNGGGSSFGLSINQTLAMALPAACNVQTPPASRCNGGANGPATATAPATSPLSSPADGSTEPSDSPADGSTEPTHPSSGSGSKTGPINNANTSDGNAVVSSIRLITASALFFAAWTVNTVKF